MSEAVTEQGPRSADQDGREGNAPVPDYFQRYLDSLKESARRHSEQEEREACAAMQSQIDREEDFEIRQFMQDTLEHYCQDGSMLVSYVYKTYWHEWISEQRALQKEVEPIELYIALESILANQSDYSGYTKTYGGPRYPLTIPGNYSRQTRVRNIDANVSRVNFLRSYYKFGVHEFHVGQAIKNILNHLEKRYGLDFRKLERSYQRAEKEKR